MDLDIDKYDDYTLWKLWAIKDDALEAVLTADEAANSCASRQRQRRRRGPATAPPATEPIASLVLAQLGDRQVRRAAPAP